LKKHLLSTSAIALGVAMASPAAAQQWDLTWGGFANTHVGITDISVDRNTLVADGNKTDFDGVDVFTNAELIFSPSVTLDNGLTFGFNVQYEALNGGGGEDGIDEVYATIEGDTLGKIVLGSENSAGYALMGSVYTPGASSMPINSRSTSAFIPVTGSGGFRQAALSSLTEVGGNNDVQRITYFTPSFNGLTVGVSYAASGEGNASNNFGVDRDAPGELKDIFDIGLGYEQSFTGVDVAFAARWGTGDRTADGNAVGTGVVVDADGNVVNSGNIGVVDVGGEAAVFGGDPTTWAVGGTIGVSGWSFGATYAENNADNPGTSVGDQEGFSVGASYDIPGPWSVGLSTYIGEVKNGRGAKNSEYEAYLLGASRSLGSGVSWDVYYVYQETNNADGGSIDGNLLATAVNLNF